jgi:uncharacterized Zn-binding protein involved in type VI secretion
MTALEAARLGDQIGHTSAMKGLLAGLAIGFIAAVAVVVITGATIATGGAAAVVIGGIIAGTAGGGLAGMKIGATFESDPKGPISSGSPNTFLGANAKPAARAVLDTVACMDHNIKFIAQGSVDVFINKTNAARKTDKTVCSAKIREGQPDVFFGGETGTYLAMEDEVPGWLVKTLEIAVWVGTAIATGGAILTVGFGAAIFGAGVSYLGGLAGAEIGGRIGERLGGERGKAIGEALGEFAGGLIGGKAAETLVPGRAPTGAKGAPADGPTGAKGTPSASNGTPTGAKGTPTAPRAASADAPAAPRAAAADAPAAPRAAAADAPAAPRAAAADAPAAPRAAAADAPAAPRAAAADAPAAPKAAPADAPAAPKAAAADAPAAPKAAPADAPAAPKAAAADAPAAPKAAPADAPAAPKAAAADAPAAPKAAPADAPAAPKAAPADAPAAPKAAPADAPVAPKAPPKEGAVDTNQAFSTANDAPAVRPDTSTANYGPDAKYQKPDGSWDWPPNEGFAGTPKTETLPVGTRIDRFGHEGGSYLSPEGTPFPDRALAPKSVNDPYHAYKVVKPLEVRSGEIAPAFDQPGGGIQYKAPAKVSELIRDGYLVEIDP